VRLRKSTCARLLKDREDLTETERHDLAEVLARWAHTEEHARRIVLVLPDRPTALDIRKAAAHVQPVRATKRPNPGCPHCFGSGFAVVITATGYTGAHPCSCVIEQPELLLASARR
jgi:hypothetical protein